MSKIQTEELVALIEACELMPGQSDSAALDNVVHIAESLATRTRPYNILKHPRRRRTSHLWQCLSNELPIDTVTLKEAKESE